MKCDELEVETVVPQGSAITLQMYGKAEVDAAIDELKQKLHDAEMQADLAECAVTEYKIDCDKLNDENRRLKRALWLARALRARDIQRWWIAATCAKITERACRVWYNVERKCQAKAKEYESIFARCAAEN